LSGQFVTKFVWNRVQRHRMLGQHIVASDLRTAKSTDKNGSEILLRLDGLAFGDTYLTEVVQRKSRSVMLGIIERPKTNFGFCFVSANHKAICSL